MVTGVNLHARRWASDTDFVALRSTRPRSQALHGRTLETWPFITLERLLPSAPSSQYRPIDATKLRTDLSILSEQVRLLGVEHRCHVERGLFRICVRLVASDLVVRLDAS